MLRKAGFDPTHEFAQSAINRLRAFQLTAAAHATRHIRALIINDGTAYARELSPRSRSVTFDFINRMFKAYLDINQIDQNAGHPGARMVIASGPRSRMPESTRYNIPHLKRLLTKLKNGIISPEQAVIEAFKNSPLAGSTVPLQANFAFTKAYLVDQAGASAGFGGPKCFVDNAFFREIPKWVSVGVSVQWRTEGMRGIFLDLKGINSAWAGKLQHREVRDADEIAAHMGMKYGSGERRSYRS
jgi:hypothetical protein